jgi:hypothetical protein
LPSFDTKPIFSGDVSIYRMKKALVLLLVVMTMSTTHLLAYKVAGGDITYTCIGQDSFIIKLSRYRDCNYSQFGSAELIIRCASTGAVIDTLNIAKPGSVDITPICNSSCSRCSSPTCTFPYGIEKYDYIALYVFDTSLSCCQIKISSKEGIRSSSITTGPASSAFEIYTTFNRCLSSTSNSISFENDPIQINCIGQDFVYNHGIVNTDTNENGVLIDSISFEWTTPINASYSSQYQYNKPIFFWGFPNANLPFPRGFHLDPYTGDISYRPMKIEETAMALKIREWRIINGSRQQIGEVVREMKVIVISCPNNNAPVLGGPYYKEICEGQSVSFSIRTNDYDTKDTLRISCNNEIPGVSWTSNNDSVKHPTGQFQWTAPTGSASSIPYVFTVTVEDDACPVVGSSTRAYQILVKPIPEVNISITDSGCQHYYLEANPLIGNINQYIWTLDTGTVLMSSGNTMNYRFTKAGIYPVTITANAQGCLGTYYDTIVVQPWQEIKLPLDTFVCEGSDYRVQADISAYDTTYFYYWSTGDSNTSTNLIRHIKKDTLISIFYSDSNGCWYRDEMTIKVIKNPVIQINHPAHICTRDSVSVNMQYSLDTTQLQQILWMDILRNKSLGNATSYRIADSGLYSIQVTDNYGCTTIDSFDVALSDIQINLGNTQYGCPNDSFIIDPVISNSGGQTRYLWSNGNTSKQGIITDVVKDSYVSLTVSDFRNCPVTEQVKINVDEMNLQVIGDRKACQGETVSLVANVYLNPPETNPLVEWFSLTDTSYYFMGDHISTTKSNTFRCILHSQNNCRIWEDIDVKIHPLPVVFAGYNDTFCSTDVYKKLIGFPDPKKGIWSGEGVVKYTNEYCFDPKLSHLQDGHNYAISYTYTDSNGCSNKDTTHFMLYNPTKTITPQAFKRVCYDSSLIPLSGSHKGGYYTGYAVVNQQYFSPIKAGLGTHKIYYHVGPLRCQRTAETSIEVIPPSNIILTTSTGKTLFCPGYGLVCLLYSPAGGGGGYFTGPVIDNTYFNADTAEGDYKIIYTFVNSLGCSNSDSLIIQVRKPGLHILKDNNTICRGENYTGQAEFNIAQGMQWFVDSVSNGQFIGSTNNTRVDYLHGTNDTYNHGFWLKAQTLDPYCSPVYDSLFVHIGLYPVAGFEVDIQNGVEPLGIQFTNLSAIDEGQIDSFYWDFGDGHISTQKNPLHSYQNAGSYDVMLKAISHYQCEDSITKKKLIHVWPVGLDEKEEQELYIYPNPTHDLLRIRASSKIESVKLYNTLGAEIQAFENISSRDFQFNLRKQAAGMYWLEIEFTNESRMLRKFVKE